jgi:hypothetical protein
VRGWRESTFVFISANPEHLPGGVEETWLAVMAALVENGATVQFICVAGSPLAGPAHSLGVRVTPYLLDRWNVVRSRSRLRKFLKRYEPVCAHSTGLEADLLLRWAARTVPNVCVASTLTESLAQATRRGPTIDNLMRHFDDTGIERVDAVFVPTEDIIGEVQAAGVPVERIVLDPPSADPTVSVARHLRVYRAFMAARGSAR